MCAQKKNITSFFVVQGKGKTCSTCFQCQHQHRVSSVRFSNQQRSQTAMDDHKKTTNVSASKSKAASKPSKLAVTIPTYKLVLPPIPQNEARGQVFVFQEKKATPKSRKGSPVNQYIKRPVADLQYAENLDK